MESLLGGDFMKDKTNKRNWFICPQCGQKICQFSDEAKAFKLFIKCKKCHNEIEIHVNGNREAITP